jgi:hypothetical protein
MKISRKVWVTGAAVLALAGAGTVGAWASGSPTPAQPQSAPRAQAVPNNVGVVDTSTESKYTPITPCRIADTRVAGGIIAVGHTRSFFVTGTTGFAPQGGHSGGCGIPTAATAISATIISVNATGSGYLRAWPYGSSTPLSSLLNYTNTAVTGSGNLAINATGARHLNVSANGHPTQVVIDVTGYFAKPLTAFVNSNATLSHGSRTTGSTLIDTGQYEVDFDRNVSACTYAASSFLGGDTLDVEPRSGNVNGVFIFIQTTAGTAVSHPFYLTVTC